MDMYKSTRRKKEEEKKEEKKKDMDHGTSPG